MESNRWSSAHIVSPQIFLFLYHFYLAIILLLNRCHRHCHCKSLPPVCQCVSTGHIHTLSSEAYPVHSDFPLPFDQPSVRVYTCSGNLFLYQLWVSIFFFIYLYDIRFVRHNLDLPFLYRSLLYGVCVCFFLAVLISFYTLLHNSLRLAAVLLVL